MTIALVARPPADLVAAYRSIGVVALGNREGVDRHQVRRWLQAAGVPLDGEKRGNLAQRRTCPADFREHYVELGLDGCIEHYRARPAVVRRWRDETGRDELRAERNQHLRGTTAAPALQAAPPAPAATPETEQTRAAAHWLRFPRHGGWIVARRPRDGMYFVGSMPMTAEQLVAFATKRGWKGNGR